MAEPTPDEVIVRELLKSDNAILGVVLASNAALLRLLVDKGILTEDDIELKILGGLDRLLADEPADEQDDAESVALRAYAERLRTIMLG